MHCSTRVWKGAGGFSMSRYKILIRFTMESCDVNLEREEGVARMVKPN